MKMTEIWDREPGVSRLNEVSLLWHRDFNDSERFAFERSACLFAVSH